MTVLWRGIPLLSGTCQLFLTVRWWISMCLCYMMANIVIPLFLEDPLPTGFEESTWCTMRVLTKEASKKRLEGYLSPKPAGLWLSSLQSTESCQHAQWIWSITAKPNLQVGTDVAQQPVKPCPHPWPTEPVKQYSWAILSILQSPSPLVLNKFLTYYKEGKTVPFHCYISISLFCCQVPFQIHLQWHWPLHLGTK